MGPSYHPSLIQKSDDITIISYHISLWYKYDAIITTTTTITSNNAFHIDNYENYIDDNGNRNYIFYRLNIIENILFINYQLIINNLIIILYSYIYFLNIGSLLQCTLLCHLLYAVIQRSIYFLVEE